jgi:glycerol-3-phosphate acyltransferase PlsY
VTTGLWIAAAYLLGALPTSYLAGRLGRGIDLREHGSRNLGATNVYRVLGWRYAIPVGVVDVTKGALPVVLCSRLSGGPAWLPVATGVAAVIGHVFSPYVRFKGGKGVATAMGMLLALAPLAIAMSALVWGLLLWLSGYVSVSSLVAAALFPVWARLTRPDAPYTFWASVALVLLIVYSHRANIRRLAAGTEHRFRTRKGPA